ncbi:MAG: hypothetical protein WB646_20060 [Steroidobacteraceae bacterium]
MYSNSISPWTRRTEQASKGTIGKPALGSWQLTAALQFAAETNLIIDRLYTSSPGERTEGGALYARYQITPRFAVAVRTESVPQYLKEDTLTTECKVAEGLQKTGPW